MTPLPPPPREVQARFPVSQRFFAAILGILLVAAVPAAIFCIGLGIDGLLLQIGGREVTARVIHAEERPDPLLGGYTRIATYVYTLPGAQERTDQSRITWGEWNRLSLPHVTPAGRPERISFDADMPAEMAVRAYAVGPLANSRAREFELGQLYLPLVLAGAATLSFLVFALWLTLVTRPRRYRRLFTHGVAVPGQVTARGARHWSKIGMRYHVDYVFHAHGSGQRVVTRREVPSVAEYDAAAPGTPVTVLHEPGHPRYSVVYEYGGYRVVSTDVR